MAVRSTVLACAAVLVAESRRVHVNDASMSGDEEDGELEFQEGGELEFQAEDEFVSERLDVLEELEDGAAEDVRRRRRRTAAPAPAPPVNKEPPALAGYGLLKDRRCGGNWIEFWKDGDGTGYGKGSKDDFAGCKVKCDAHDECHGFYYKPQNKQCQHWRTALTPNTVTGAYCYYKLDKYSPPTFLPQIESLPSSIEAGSSQDTVLHYAYPHHVDLLDSSKLASGLSGIKAPSKGVMRGVVGDGWELQLELSEAEQLGFLPEGEPGDAREGKFKYEIKTQIQQWTVDTDTARRATMKWEGWYWTGKLLQKVGMICLLSEKYFGVDDRYTQKCATLLENAFKCLYEPANSGKFGRKAAGVCRGKPAGHYWNSNWGGIASEYGYDAMKGCRGQADFGNACFNDHHYHYGYMVVSAAILAKLKPEYRTDAGLRDFVSVLIRDTTNPSRKDKYFTQFRHFDWFDMHSWSRGITPNEYGKDQESVSEELNLFWGIHLWGGITNDAPLQRLGTTMLGLAVNTAQRYFFTLRDTEAHYGFENFNKRHVPGIFFQTMVTYTTWFCQYACKIGIHAIQMMPLTPALPMVRTKEFCQEEHEDALVGLKFPENKHWESVHVTGSTAFLDPEKAYYRISDLSPRKFDDGLTKTWALYWAASRPGAKGQKPLKPEVLSAGKDLPKATSLLNIVNGGKKPDAVGFRPIDWHLMEPSHTDVKGPKATNKYWVNWVVDNRTIAKGTGAEFAIFPMPYVIKWGEWSRQRGKTLPPALEISHSDPEFGYKAWAHRTEGVPTYSSDFKGEFSMSAVEGAYGGGHTILEESQFGIHVQVRGPAGTDRQITFPIYSGLAYISGRYVGFTPKVAGTVDRKFVSITKVKDGIWSAKNDNDVEFRVYILDSAGEFIGSDFEFDAKGAGNQVLDGWMRMAHVINPKDTEVLDAHARAIIVGWDFDVQAGGTVTYSFKKAAR